MARRLLGNNVPVRHGALTHRVNTLLSNRPLPSRACEEHRFGPDRPRSRKIRDGHDCIITAIGVPIGDRPRSGVEIETELLMERLCTCAGCGDQHKVLDDDGLWVKERVLHRQVIDPKDIISPLEDPDSALRELLDGAS